MLSLCETELFCCRKLKSATATLAELTHVERRVELESHPSIWRYVYFLLILFFTFNTLNSITDGTGGMVGQAAYS